MKKNVKTKFFFFIDIKLIYVPAILLIIITACKKPYNPKVVSSPDKFIVVEGIVNSGADSTFIKLSRTVPVNNTTVYNPETGALVTVEGEDNTTYPLANNGNGIYVSAGLNLNAAKKYRLRITTADNIVYLSNFEQVKVAPSIDSIGYAIKSNGVQLYSNAHDATNDTRYYRFEYDEDWKFHAAYNTGLEAIGKDIVSRAKNIYMCYTKDKSTNITIGSTAKLGQDVLYQQPIAFIPSNSEKISVRYSVLLKQYALTKEAYSFWEQLRANTERLGSIFDPQPSQSIGNIKCITDPSKIAIGYISIGTVQTKRAYINRTELPADWRVDYGCNVDTVFFKYGIDLLFFHPPSVNPIDKALNSNNVWLGYLYSSIPCTDCTTRGALMKPAFWKDE
ncbi:DUF4249 domain-containing protein [Mucilaginibacter sp. CAU 1740]|uniref:DUF4249 domain-containing protein n=1 Tax=Mucilaginibacter sp. CAU 1740 TaxID=3140365 RepID=UPI00325A9243